MKKEIRTEILINRTPEKVWKVFIEFDKYSEWNPFIKSLTGNVSKGSRIKAVLQPQNSKPMVFKPEVLTFNQNRELRWLGKLFLPRIFDGEHIFELKDNRDGTTTFIHSENFRGILVRMMRKKLDGDIKKGFELMNSALKQRVENEI